jgi:hypothetical protein
MAVKPITTKNTVANRNINRAEQIDNSKLGNFRPEGNRQETLAVGKNFQDGYQITLKDIDTSIISHIKNVIKPTVKEANEIIKVPVLYGNEERWKSIRSRGVIRDKNNSLMLPLIVLRRTDTNFTDSMPYSFDHDVSGQFTSMVRAKKWSPKNRYDRFGIQHGKTPIYDMILTGMPDFVTCTYQIVMMTSYIEQMNFLTELIIEHENTYWGDTQSYKFLSALEGSFADATEMDVAGERIVKCEFGISMKGYVTPRFANSTTGPGANIQKARSIGKVSFGTETEVDISKK